MVTRAQLLLIEKLKGDKSNHEFSPWSLATVREIEASNTVMILWSMRTLFVSITFVGTNTLPLTFEVAIKQGNYSQYLNENESFWHWNAKFTKIRIRCKNELILKILGPIVSSICN